jgi:hypothetical protein
MKSIWHSLSNCPRYAARVFLFLALPGEVSWLQRYSLVDVETGKVRILLNTPLSRLKYSNVVWFHLLVKPWERVVSQQGNVDWFDFWLNEHEDPDSAKTDQYLRWRKLRDQRDAMLREPRPPLLKWDATPLIGDGGFSR